MQHFRKPRVTSATLAIAGVLAFSGHAVADQVDATVQALTGYSGGSNVTVDITYGNGTTESFGTWAGLWTFTQNSGPLETYSGTYGVNDFLSFCIDLEDPTPIGVNHIYDVKALAASPDPRAGPMEASRARNLSALLGTVIGSSLNDAATELDDSVKQAAMQIAVWEVVHDDDLDISSKGASGGAGVKFSDMTGEVSMLAQDYLDNLKYDRAMTGLVGLGATDGSQDFVGQVPIPPAAWLFGSALVGVAALGRRTRKVEAEA